MAQKIVLLLTGLLLMGCNAQVSDFVRGGGNPEIGNPIQQINSGPMAIKVSPGHGVATSAQVTMEATVTPTKRTLQGGPVSASVTMSRTRVAPQ